MELIKELPNIFLLADTFFVKLFDSPLIKTYFSLTSYQWWEFGTDYILPLDKKAVPRNFRRTLFFPRSSPMVSTPYRLSMAVYFASGVSHCAQYWAMLSTDSCSRRRRITIWKRCQWQRDRLSPHSQTWAIFPKKLETVKESRNS